MTYSRASIVMTNVYNLIPESAAGVPIRVQNLPITEADALFEAVYHSFLDVLYSSDVDRTRKHELNYATAYQLMRDNDSEGILAKKRIREST